ncbi:hypothetical protein NPA31_019015 [Aurantimonas sp. MSK8Z-1]|uniref:hypothetical protein n=1 Tax=Mangrovibrevibacter kandeliae TaxID=2968473 RepID=UPI00211780CE|nr:hypothetical protein [Aurantimonas sp. MSK8Z-1]MCW4117056.1 hypothetical protein [Aurantimonas sp. MSK8Z-1]
MTAVLKQQFTARPDYLIPHFHEHLTIFGQPHTWSYHSHEKPPPGEIEVLVRDFHIPEHHIRTKGLAPCPICSPNHPQYGRGHLLWSPISGKLYAVGHCCGHNHFVNGVFSESFVKERKRRERRLMEAYLEKNHARVAEFARFALNLEPAAREHDRIVRLLISGLTLRRTMEIYRLAAGGEGNLVVYRDGKGEDGERGSLRGQLERFGTYPLKGYEVLRKSRSKKSAEARIKRAAAILPMVGWQTYEDAFAWLCEAPDADLRKLSGVLQDAQQDFKDVVAEMNDLSSFLARDNLKLLTAWSKEQDALQAQLGIYRSSDLIVSVWRGDRQVKSISLPEGFGEVPVLPDPLQAA